MFTDTYFDNSLHAWECTCEHCHAEHDYEIDSQWCEWCQNMAVAEAEYFAKQGDKNGNGQS